MKKREELEVVPDYGRRIKEARERLGLSRETLATKIGIKVATLRSIENQDIPLDLETAKKLEEVLGIKLLQEPSEADEASEEEIRGITGADIMAFRSKWEEAMKKRKRKRSHE